MAVSRITVELFYDVVSPYSYIAFETLIRYRTPWNLDLKLTPFFLGGVMKEANNKPPAFVPNKGAYMMTDIRRLSPYYGVPIKIPDFFIEFITTKSTIKPQRFLVALDQKHPQYLEEASRGFWKRFYQDNKDIAEEDSIAEVGRAVGMNEEALKEALAMIKEDSVKKALAENTKRAVDEYGAFGAPTIVAHVGGKPEVFFGSDRFELLAHVMGKKWLGPQPSAAKL
uniref:Glutathione S-transferase kappa n=1 Tax=Amblyomma parvum TaxID=251391 RepID=A0A023FUN8_AMBPA